MYNAYIVLLSSDTDCDGTSYAAHKVAVPQHRLHEMLSSVSAASRYAAQSGQTGGSYDCYAVMTVAAFRREYFPGMDKWDREYFHHEGYTSRHMGPRWNAWVYDDSIGIPALDSRYDD